MLPACPPRSRNRPEPAFAWQLAAAPPRRAGHHPVHPAPLPCRAGFTALSHCRTGAFCPLPHRQPHKHQKPHKPHESQKSAKSSSCVLRYWGFRTPFQPVFLENAAHNTAQYGMSRPAGRWETSSGSKSHPTSVCAAISYESGLEPNPKPQYRSTVLNTPTKSAPSTPHQRFKNAALSEPTSNIPVVCCVLLKKSRDLEANTQISQHAQRAGAGRGEPR